jgi:hypothetical protein
MKSELFDVAALAHQSICTLSPAEGELLNFQRGRDSPIGKQKLYDIRILRNRKPATFELPEVILDAGHIALRVFLPVRNKRTTKSLLPDTKTDEVIA